MSDNKGPVNVDIGASAKLEIKTEIPSDASGRLAHAITDAISPITEALGLLGDTLRTARIHRRLVAEKVLRAAAADLSRSGVPIQHVPLKIAVPLLEHASQEDPDDEIMIRLWAKMLASAATNDAVSPRFVSLLSEMNKRQILLLLEVFNFEDVHRDDLRGFCQRLFQQALAFDSSQQPAPHIVADIVKSAGPALLYLNTYTPLDARKTPNLGLKLLPTKFKSVILWEPERQRATDLGILESLGLLHFSSTDSGYFPDDASYIAINRGSCTPIGDELLYLIGEADPEE